MKIRDIAGEARFYVVGMKAQGLPAESAKSLNGYVFDMEYAGTHLAPIEVNATFTRLHRVTMHETAASTEVRAVTLDLHVSDNGSIWVYMHGGPTGFESFGLLDSGGAPWPVGRVPGRGWMACYGTVDSWPRCYVEPDEMDRAFRHWGRR